MHTMIYELVLYGLSISSKFISYQRVRGLEHARRMRNLMI